MVLRVLMEGVGLGVILMLVCAVGIRNGAVGMVHPDQVTYPGKDNPAREIL